jgi:hypothetical protein
MAEVIEGMPLSEYLALPRVSASDVKNMLVCAKWAQYNSWLNPKRPPMTSTDAQGIGSLAHELLLEGSAANVQIIKPEDHPSKQTKKDDPPKIPKGWTNDSIRAARDSAIAAGMIPVLPWDMYAVTQMVDSAKEFIESLKDTVPEVWGAFRDGGGRSEITILWDDDGVPCRIRPDRLSTNGDVSVHYKTGGTSAEPEQWGRTQYVRMGYYLSAAFYGYGIEKVCGVQSQQIFLVQEQSPPFLCSLVGLDADGYRVAMQKIRFALEKWEECMEKNEWPGHDPIIQYPALPAWEDWSWQPGDWQT